MAYVDICKLKICKKIFFNYLLLGDYLIEMRQFFINISLICYNRGIIVQSKYGKKKGYLEKIATKGFIMSLCSEKYTEQHIYFPPFSAIVKYIFY